MGLEASHTRLPRRVLHLPLATRNRATEGECTLRGTRLYARVTPDQPRLPGPRWEALRRCTHSPRLLVCREGDHEERSEERRVGKEWRDRWGGGDDRGNARRK